MTGFGFLLLGVLALLVMAGVSLLAGRAQRRRQQQMQERLQALRDNMPKAAGVARPQTTALPGPQFLRLWLTRADIAPTPRSLGAAALAIVLVALIVNWLAGPLAAALAAVTLTFAGIYGLWRLACRRLDAFIEGLPFFLDALRQLLVVGNSIQQGLLKAAENTSPAMQRYLQPMIRRVNNGAPIPESIEWLAQRLELAELYMLAAAVETNFRYGGRMSNVLANLIQILRDRARVERELKAATAEIRFSAIVLGLMPLLTAALIFLIKPSYVAFFIETEQGHRLAIIAAGLQLTGMVVMRRIMRLEF
ncbi:type II secretion system F family protein [Inquilinus sp. CA228]|uniref:type II secretion system F family protein n=1 Tax=Inquilinus sp. CA228 TaxID=3455609 RepID=UPI003F8D5D2C